MFRKLYLTALSAITVIAMSTSVQAEPVKLTFDKPHTSIVFYVSHLGFAKSHGRFLDFDGFINFDQAAPEKSNVEMTIKTASIDMDHEKWNDHMKNEDFFNVEKFPDMTFKSTGIEVTGENTANITGDLTILDVTKPVVLATTHNKTGKHAFSGKMVSGFSATASIKRSDFGIKYGLPAVGDDVEIRLEVEAPQDDKGANDVGN